MLHSIATQQNYISQNLEKKEDWMRSLWGWVEGVW
jgi:hypothetical protein